ncbi:hypothetical protein [Blastochloris viridis]|uniref:Uncharacterized protein n=1 Tax=Blastochloris viridis TaxID=1079 RepID=A0A182D519_BLAVI|nr:hypothetical protein [Blastochloris viridis]BAS00591.1 hypothetical protein BV133_2997 [Blastochloris viridis]
MASCEIRPIGRHFVVQISEIASADHDDIIRKPYHGATEQRRWTLASAGGVRGAVAGQPDRGGI